MDIIFAPINFIIKFPFIVCGWFIVGIVAGDLARRLMKAVDRPFWEDLILGIVGAFVGGFVAGLVGIGTPESGIPALIGNIVVATGGAALIIWIRRQMMSRGKSK